MATQHPGHFLHRLQIGLERSGHPVVEELSCEVGALILPEPLEILAQQVALDRGQVVSNRGAIGDVLKNLTYRT